MAKKKEKAPAVKRRKLQWTKTDNIKAVRQGWSVFDCDIGRFEIQGLTWEDGLTCQNNFEGKDDEAVAFVIRRALLGEKHAIKALIMCMLLDPYSMGWVMTNALDSFLPTGWDNEFHGLYSAIKCQSTPPSYYRELAQNISDRIFAGLPVHEEGKSHESVDPDDVDVMPPGHWENDQGPKDWWAVCTEQSGGIIAYARDEEGACAIKDQIVEGRMPP